MDLEVISKTPKHSKADSPIVLIHGAWHAAWCWENRFLDYFAKEGWCAHALSLRGHGASAGRNGLRWWSISDYVDDVTKVVSSLDRLPILVGHSLGGFVVQKYLERHRAAGAVLLASVPPSGTLKLNLRIIRKHPVVWLTANLTMKPYLIIKNPNHARNWFFSPTMSQQALAEHHAKLQDESYRAALDMLALNLPKPHLIDTPVAVLGGEEDQMFSVSEIAQTARAYGVEPKIFPAMAHNMMSEPNWEFVAAWIVDWATSVLRIGEHGQAQARG